MAFFAGVRATDDWGTDERPKSFRETILFLNPNGKSPLFALTEKLGSSSVTDPQFSWWNERNTVTDSGLIPENPLQDDKDHLNPVVHHSAYVPDSSDKEGEEGVHVGGAHEGALPPVSGTAELRDKGHLHHEVQDGVDYVVQQENRPSGFADEAQFAEKNGGGEHDEEADGEKDRDAGGESAFQNGAVEKIIIVRQMPRPPQNTCDEMI